MTKKEETYNEAVEKLRKIVADIENGDLDVDVLSEKVKEASVAQIPLGTFGKRNWSNA